jgi:tRNA (guanosine-2'-O-)-methyltransferase
VRRAGGASAALVTLLLAASCQPPPPSSGSGVSASLAAANITASGVELQRACTPSGEELCFNAVDDNCNGVVDEGCGLCTGVLQFTIAWGGNPADVDLHVFDPSGGHVSPAQRTTSSGLKLDRACPDARGCGGQNIENVCFEGDDPPRGHYTVEARLAAVEHGGRPAQLPVSVTLGARVGGRTFSGHLELTGKDDKKSFTFDL